MKKENQNIIIYKTKDNQIELETKLEKETVWLTQEQMSMLFDKDRRTITEHIGNVYSEGELDENRTRRKFQLVRKEGNREVTRNIEHYNLDVIISVGYRVKSLRGTQFRIWATNVLRDHIVQGYTINEKRLKEQSEKFSDLQNAVKTLTSLNHDLPQLLFSFLFGWLVVEV